MKLQQRMAVAAICTAARPGGVRGPDACARAAPRTGRAPEAHLARARRGHRGIHQAEHQGRGQRGGHRDHGQEHVGGADRRLQARGELDRQGRHAVGGDVYRHPKPFMPDEVITVTLKTPKNARMTSNSYNFSHANGTVKPKTCRRSCRRPSRASTRRAAARGCALSSGRPFRTGSHPRTSESRRSAPARS